VTCRGQAKGARWLTPFAYVVSGWRADIDVAEMRARQDVLLELGYFIGRLGRNKVCALKRGELEIPSDFGGVVYEPFDTSGGETEARPGA
jgi:predicted nucleotide-binding protein